MLNAQAGKKNYAHLKNYALYSFSSPRCVFFTSARPSTPSLFLHFPSRLFRGRALVTCDAAAHLKNCPGEKLQLSLLVKEYAPLRRGQADRVVVGRMDAVGVAGRSLQPCNARQQLAAHNSEWSAVPCRPAALYACVTSWVSEEEMSTLQRGMEWVLKLNQAVNYRLLKCSFVFGLHFQHIIKYSLCIIWLQAL